MLTEAVFRWGVLITQKVCIGPTEGTSKTLDGEGTCYQLCRSQLSVPSATKGNSLATPS